MEAIVARMLECYAGYSAASSTGWVRSWHTCRNCMPQPHRPTASWGLCLVLLRAGLSLAELPVGVLREVCRLLAHADIEQARLTSKAMRSAVGKAAVTDMCVCVLSLFACGAALHAYNPPQKPSHGTRVAVLRCACYICVPHTCLHV